MRVRSLEIYDLPHPYIEPLQPACHRAGLAFEATSSLSHRTWAVLGERQIRHSLPGPQQPCPTT